MSVSDQDENGRSPDQPSDASTPPGAGGGETPPPPPPSPPARARRHGWRRVANRRNAMWAGIVAVVAVVGILFLLFVLYRSGQVD
ncbi:MAG TPA: hypothetical protein VGV38_23485, partial [Pyrinomonadaceae bacterium]|nr:hypothetical protein [Pyrinomonadaceae bacterium]